MPKVYIASSPYHILISITKTIAEGRIGKDDIIIFQWMASPSIVENLHTFFRDVKIGHEGPSVIIDLLCLKIYISHIPLLANLVGKVIKKKEKWFKERDVYIFNDNYYHGCLLNSLKIEYNLIEDGLNCYMRKREAFFAEIKKRNRSFRLLNLSWESFGLSKYTKSIEVNDASKITIKNLNIIECNRDQMFRNLGNNEIDAIAKVFNYQPLNIPSLGEASLLLTQPLSEDNIVSHEKKIKIYKHLADKYAIGTLYIKVHPRDKDDYSKVFPSAMILGASEIPFEVYLLKEKFHFRRVFSAFTTLTDAIFCADEKIQLGMDWVLNFK